jgi:protein gp37
MVFVNSMSDLFHPLVPFEYVDRVWEVMAETPRHVFQVLTKRPERMSEYVLGRQAEPLPNVWLGTSIENDRWVSRADALRAAPAAVRFLSCEPLLGPLPSLNLDGITWVIAGGESGFGHRPLDPEWVIELRDACGRSGAAFFFKQWGGRTPRAGGRQLEGRTWDEMPVLHEVNRSTVPSG